MIRTLLLTAPLVGLGAACTDPPNPAPVTRAGTSCRFEPGVRFTDVTVRAGLDSVNWVRPLTLRQSKCHVAIAQGPGAAAGDFDNDGFIDLFVIRYDLPNQLFRNLGDGTFKDVAAEANVAADGLQSGAAWGDIDNDGDLDLYVTSVLGRTFLYVNLGNGTFEEQAESRGVLLTSGEGFCAGMYSASFSDFDHDGDLDLHTADASEDGFEFSRLFLNDGTGVFSDATASSGLKVAEYHFTPTLIDVDGDHWEDYLSVSDFGTSKLFLNQQDGTFKEVTQEWKVGTDDSGMGSTAADVNGDGLIDWFITAIARPGDVACQALWGCTGNRLFINTGESSYEDQTDEYGVRLGGWGWGTAFVDYDLDADLDIAMVAGFAPADPERTDEGLELSLGDFAVDPVRLWENTADKPWQEVSQEIGFVDERESKAFIPFDYDNDGDLDFFLTNTGSSPSLFRNDAPCERTWLRVQAVGTDSNRLGIGAEIYVTRTEGEAPLRRDISGSSNYLGQAPAEAHFGLGSVQTVAEVRVYWPATGRTTRLNDVSAGQVLTVEEPSK